MNMISAISVGCAAGAVLRSCSVFQVHSVFERAVNLTSPDDRMISLSVKAASDFPANVRTEVGAPLTFLSLGVKQGDIVRTEKGIINLHGVYVVYTDAPTYLPAVFSPIPAPDKQSIDNALALLSHTVGSLPEARGLSPVVTVIAGGTADEAQAVADDLCRSVWRAASRIISSDFSLHELPDTLDPLIGRGIGLTPSGDDFSAGLMLALHLGFRSLARDLSVLDDTCWEVVSRSQGTTRFSREMLFYAGRGQLTAAAERVVLASLSRANGEISPAIAALLEYGASSGVDQLAGIAAGLRLIARLI